MGSGTIRLETVKSVGRQPRAFLTMARTIVPYLLALQVPFVPGASSGRTCKTSPASPDWPLEDAWAHLAQAVDGRLLTVPPPGAVCHPDQPTYNNASCAEVQAEWSSQAFHSYNPVSLMFGVNNASCLPDPTEPCYPQGFPAYVIEASTSRHVELGVQFGMCRIGSWTGAYADRGE